MDKMKKILVYSLVVLLFISCSNNETKKEKMEKEEVKELVLESSEWFKKKKQIYIFDSTKELSADWNKSIVNWIIESNFFSKDFISKFNYEFNNDKHIGLYFFDSYEFGNMLKAFCNSEEELILTEIEKVSENSYRYTTTWGDVLNSVPDPNYDESLLWLYETGKNGERWQFSMLIIKENNKWVIDKIERHFAVVQGI